VLKSLKPLKSFRAFYHQIDRWIYVHSLCQEGRPCLSEPTLQEYFAEIRVLVDRLKVYRPPAAWDFLAEFEDSWTAISLLETEEDCWYFARGIHKCVEKYRKSVEVIGWE
jgi:hypothetical protein